MAESNSSSRRDFLKKSVLATAGVTLAGGLSVARTAHAAGSEQIRIALIGAGDRGTGAVHNCLESNDGDIKVVAVADAFADRAKFSVANLQKTFKDRVDIPPERIFVGFDAYQKALDCGVDMVILATPPGFRPIHYEAAVKAGKNVFMEKPCCIDAPGFNKVMAANKLADEKGLKVGVGLQRRHDKGYIEGVKRIQEGSLGDVNFMRAYWNGNTPWIRQRQPKQTEMEYQMRNWYFFIWLCGDNICEQHVHNIDVANWVKGDHPVEANGMGGREVRKGKDVGHIFDHHFIEFTYKDGTKLYSQCRHQSGTWNCVTEAVHGTKGSSGCQSGRHSPNPYNQEHVDLIKAIRDNDKYNEGWYGATSSMTAILGRMATYSGQVVKWDDAVKLGPDEMPKKFAWDALPKVVPDKDGSYEYAVAVPGVYKPY
jgi:predicted dehydrogenase